jgi:hypothetical protein
MQNGHAGQDVAVDIGECRCPGTPHDSDTVWLRGKPDLAMGLAFRQALRESGRRTGDLQATIGDIYLRYGVVAWTITGEDRKPLPVSHAAVIERLPWPDALPVVDAADDLYGAALVDPLVKTKASSPQPSPDAPSTSASSSSAPPALPSSPQPSPSRRAAGRRSATTGASH